MDEPALAHAVQATVQPGKGILATDQSNPTCNKRCAKLGIAQTVEARPTWRELILTTEGFETTCWLHRLTGWVGPEIKETGLDSPGPSTRRKGGA
jgi:hypothetical protein